MSANTVSQFLAGDFVHHGPSGEEWVLATDEEKGEVMPSGWPECIAKASDCTLQQRATPEQRLKILTIWAAPHPDAAGERDRRTLTARRQLAAADQTSISSCVGCKWLYQQGAGYSNYTWEEDYVRCAQDRNANLTNGGMEAPYDWKNETPEEDNWPMTNKGRCALYSPGPFITLDVDGENGPADYTEDEAQIEGICRHSGRGRNGYSSEH